MKRLLLTLALAAPLYPAAPAAVDKLEADLEAAAIATVHESAKQPVAEAPDFAAQFEHNIRSGKAAMLWQYADQNSWAATPLNYIGGPNIQVHVQQLQDKIAKTTAIDDPMIKSAQWAGIFKNLGEYRKNHTADLDRLAHWLIRNCLKDDSSLADITQIYLGPLDPEQPKQYWDARDKEVLDAMAQLDIPALQEIHRHTSFLTAWSIGWKYPSLEVEGKVERASIPPGFEHRCNSILQKFIPAIRHALRPTFGNDVGSLITQYVCTGMYRAADFADLYYINDWRPEDPTFMRLRNTFSIQGLCTYPNAHGINILDLSYNALTELDPEEFRPLIALQQLSVDSNKLKTLPLMAILTYCPELTRLVATNNQFSDVVKKHMTEVWAKAGKQPENLKL